MPWEKQFDRDVVLGKAEAAFWTGGYDATSMDALLSSMGIQKGSFYATFGSKHAVLMETLNRYILDRFAGFQELALRHSPAEALRRHLTEVLQESTGKYARRGCYLVNASIELAPRDPEVWSLVQKTLEAHAAFYQKVLEAAQALGEVPQALDAHSTATALLGLVLGMRVMARAGMPASVMATVHGQALALFRDPAEG